MISRFFINRPIFATVLSLMIVIAGILVLRTLPVSQYPKITPPTIQVYANYAGADAQVVADTVGQIIEQQVNGVEGMLYMNSVSDNGGNYTLTVTFEVGMDMDIAQVLVQNRVALAQPLLPDTVKKIGVTTKKQSTNIVLMLYLHSDNPKIDDLYLNNYATLYLKDELSRLDGTGDIFIYGAGDYSMRIWLDPQLLKTYSLTTKDVATALSEQNIQVAAGQIGQPPSAAGQPFQYIVQLKGRLVSIEEFENIIIKADDNRIVRIKDVGSVTLGSKSYMTDARVKGKPAALVAVFSLPDANAINLSKSVHAKMEELEAHFPEGLHYDYLFNTTDFIQESLREVIHTLIIAILLVCFTIFFFLQGWRATIIPIITIPVSLIGTFILMGTMGFSINLLTLFGLVLSIGIVVDDAIIVVENVTRNMDEKGLSGREAAIKAMDEVTGPIVATTLVLMSVFLPASFMGGVTGQLYRQFALTIAVSTFFSAINALTLSPALCAIILKPTKDVPKKNFFIFRWFNKGLQSSVDKYKKITRHMVQRTFLAFIILAVLVVSTIFGMNMLPKGFFPQEDQGYAMGVLMLPSASSLSRTSKTCAELDQYMAKIPGIKSWSTIAGYSILDGAQASDAAAFWVVFDEWSKRAKQKLTQDKILMNINIALSQLTEARGFVFLPPGIAGLGSQGGFEMKLQDRENLGPAALQEAISVVTQAGNQTDIIAHLNSTYRSNIPQYFLDVDRDKAKRLGIPLSDIFGTLQTMMGGAYINDFNLFGKTYQVNIQADTSARMKEIDLERLEVRNIHGEMIPLGTLVSLKPTTGPLLVNRFNMYPSASISGAAVPGRSSEALKVMEDIVKKTLPPSMGSQWTGMAYQEKVASSGTILIFLLSAIFVYLVLCAQYESWTVSFCVMLSIPLALIGTVIAIFARQMDINIYTQVGILLLIAMAAKTAILIVEFAVDLHKEGKTVIEAAMEAARLRYRPILMTSFAFVLGVLPLVWASGIGAASRQALGTPVFFGMITGTIFCLLLVPAFYAAIEKKREKFVHIDADKKASSFQK